jgi:hypothetical protein
MLHTRSICSLRFRSQAATVPTRWLLPRPDKGHRTASSGGSLEVSISCGLPFLARPPEVRVVTPHPVQDHDVLDNGAKFDLSQVGLRSRDQPGKSPEQHQGKSHGQPRWSAIPLKASKMMRPQASASAGVAGRISGVIAAPLSCSFSHRVSVVAHATTPARFLQRLASGKRDSEPDRDEGKGAHNGGPLRRR